jgi:hypothetical protein
MKITTADNKETIVKDYNEVPRNVLVSQVQTADFKIYNSEYSLLVLFYS